MPLVFVEVEEELPPQLKPPRQMSNRQTPSRSFLKSWAPYGVDQSLGCEKRDYNKGKKGNRKPWVCACQLTSHGKSFRRNLAARKLELPSCYPQLDGR